MKIEQVICLSMIVGLGYLALRQPSQPPIAATITGSPEPVQGVPVRLVPGSVHDGDTLRVVSGTTELKIRLCGIDAPELAQEYGGASRDELRRLTKRADLRLIAIEEDRYGRTVGELMAGNLNLNAQMATAGMAYHYAKYSANCPGRSAITAGEAAAIKARRGVWAADLERPWDYRKVKARR